MTATPHATDWLILHGGALGDLVLTLQLALRLPGDDGGLDVVSRVHPGDLSMCRPGVRRRSSEGLGLHWLFGDHDDPAPGRLRELIAGRRVLSALAGPHALAHQRLAELRPAALFGLDPRPRPEAERHITQQWHTQLEAQGLLVPKCVHQRPAQRGLGVPEELRGRGRALAGRAMHEHQERDHARAAGRAASEAARATSDATGGVVAASAVTVAKEPYVLVHPGSGGRAKCWPVGRFVEVARELRRLGRTVCFVLGPAEIERGLEPASAALGAPQEGRDGAACAEGRLADGVLPGEFPVVRCPEPDELLALVAGAAAYLGNDAGPTHLAALVGTPTVALFGPTSPRVWRPLGAQVRVVAGNAGGGADWGLVVAEVVEQIIGVCGGAAV
jgi:hypothetical protein